MGSVAALLLGPLRPYILGAALLVGASLAGWAWLARHDAALRTAWQAERDAAVAAAVTVQRAEGDAALIDAINEAEARARQSVAIREVIRHAPPSACPLPAALSVAADELRRRAGADRARGAGSPGQAVPAPGHP